MHGSMGVGLIREISSYARVQWVGIAQIQASLYTIGSMMVVIRMLHHSWLGWQGDHIKVMCY